MEGKVFRGGLTRGLTEGGVILKTGVGFGVVGLVGWIMDQAIGLGG